MPDLTRLYKPGDTVRLEFRKWDDRLHYHWEVSVLEVYDDRLLAGMAAGTVFHHAGRGYNLKLPHDGRLAFWEGRWYSGGPDFEPGTSRVLEYYFNVNTPPEFEPGIVRTVDLELDLKARPDLSVEEFDWGEFEEAKARYGYPAWLERRVRLAALEVRALLEARGWPVLAPQPAEGHAWLERGPG